MRVLKVLPFLLLFSIPLPAQTTTSAQGDPQAIALVQAAITALGGATAIGQAQSWTSSAEMQGPHANGTIEYKISTHTDTGMFLLANGTTKPAPPIRSHFLPALVGTILLKQSQDPQFSILYAGTSALPSGPVAIVVFATSQPVVTVQVTGRK